MYDRLGTSAGNILLNAVIRPQLIGQALLESLTHGNLVWGLLFPFLCLPLLRPRWILIATPVLLQHLLSWRSSEWMIYFHYGAPLLPLFWIASVEAIAAFDRWKLPALLPRIAPWLIVVACLIAQLWLGFLSGIVSRSADWFEGGPERARKNAFIAQIPPTSSVVAPLPYLSHLAMREKLYSLHYVLKGLKTLSRSSYEPPPPTDFVLIDYRDTATFDPSAGFYHPTMKTVDGRIIPSSDRLLHDFLRRTTWSTESQDELTLLRNTGGAMTAFTSRESLSNEAPVFAVGATQLLAIETGSKAISPSQLLEIRLRWRFQGEREVFPWMLLRLSRDQRGTLFVKGLCAPEVAEGTHLENWTVTTTELLPGDYILEALFLDNSKQSWSQTIGRIPPSNLLAPPVSLGHLEVEK